MQDDALMGKVAARSPKGEALMQDPEARRHIADTIRTHWKAWVDEKLPALGGRTPREAVTDSGGREAVEALLLDAERRGKEDPTTGEMNRDGIRLARKLLGLIKS